MKIGELPVEILMKIFSYLPSFDKVSLVNRQFYNVACKLSDPKICLKLNSSLFKDLKKNIQILQSIKNSKRNITNVSVYLYTQTEEVAFKSMISIIRKFSATIKYLKFHAVLELSDFLEILTLVPNAVHLVFDFVRTVRVDNQPSQKKRRVIPDNEDLNLHQLKTLKFQHCNDEFVVLFNRLPAGVLTELTLDNNLDELNVLFKRQTNIKKLTIEWSTHGSEMATIAADLFDNQKLESLEWHFHSFNHSNIETILSKQTKLKSLKLIDGIVGEDVMNAVVDQLTELETLSIYLPETPIAAFKNINKLRNLSELTLQSNEDRHVTHFEAFATLDNSRITTLDIQYVYNMSDDLIAALAKSVPNLKAFRFNCDYNFRIFNATMKNFNFIEILQFETLNTDFEYYYDYVDDSTLFQGDCVNPHLIELKITYVLPYKRAFLKKMVKDYPNLKKLVIQSMTPITASQFKLILNGFKTIESLTLLQGASKLSMDDLNYLKEHKNHLKFISLMDLESIKCTARIMKKLSTIFDVVQFSEYDGLKMAVDRKTMKTERIY